MWWQKDLDLVANREAYTGMRIITLIKHKDMGEASEWSKGIWSIYGHGNVRQMTV